ncbi:ribonuclease P protein subunit p14-like isoform X2 [Acipenser ruthenus]|uniref:ribonuclease P protein subunit p14-like isoform X2 n=2 Tax=Acipenser ruthenus TaxID=7906 RepID=UPI00145A102D|nr:ribonuclease P protein subunit p14-like isoform X2 [Acipenser ruthenus]
MTGDIYYMFLDMAVEYFADCIHSMRRHDTKDPETASYERLVFRNASDYHYMKISLIFEGGNIRLNAAHFKQLIISSLRELYGEIGAALPFDVLKFEENTLSAVLRVYSSALVRLWSALTLLGGYQGQPCGVRVVQVTPFLLALSGNSRELKLD